MKNNVNNFERRRKLNERKFDNWQDLPGGGRKYWFEIRGKFGYLARYLKEVNSEEKTIRFSQEIYNSDGDLIEIHRKYPVDEGHKIVKENKK